VQALLYPKPRNRFLTDFLPFQRLVARFGVWNSLAQTVLKLTSPGVPDIYQGNELFEFNLVDPDNRRPVDYLRRRQALEALLQLDETPGPELTRMLETLDDGRLKLYCIWKTLSFRKQHADLFATGLYEPLSVQGAKSNHVIAFERNHEHTSAIVVVPRLIATLLGDAERPPVGSEIWENTKILLPIRPGSSCYQNIFAGTTISLHPTGSHALIDVAEILGPFPVALLYSSVAAE
jgi:(1->4)-alpha-D-glucan 1-alpha-D-glucosylmutase